MNAKLIGIGAAGNKAAIRLIEEGILPRANVLLLNSTLKDIPAEYKDISIQFSESSGGGCGKEREIAKRLILESLQNGKLVLDNILDPDDKMVIIVNSSEGGTGCGASTIIAKYFREVLRANVHMFVFTGFEEDGRGLKNTVEYFQDLQESYIVQAISNKKFLKESGGNKLRAESLANEEFCKRIKILLGQLIVDSSNNIDETDLTKLATTPGFMMIEYGELTKIKNIDMFNKAVTDIIDNSKSLDIVPSAKRIGVILNIEDRTKDNIDYLFTVIKERLGTPFEMYSHVQTELEPEFIAIIASGIKMPIDDVKDIYEKYKEESEKVNKARDKFFDVASDMKSNSDDNIFNMGEKSSQQSTDVDKRSFFNSFAPTTANTQPESKKFANVKKIVGDKEDPSVKEY